MHYTMPCYITQAKYSGPYSIVTSEQARAKDRQRRMERTKTVLEHMTTAMSFFFVQPRTHTNNKQPNNHQQKERFVSD